MFQFSGFPSAHYGFMYGWQDRSCRVSPFRHLRIVAYVQLPAAFRSLSRLSSAPSARASALRPFLLNLLIFDLRFSGGLAIALAFLQFFRRPSFRADLSVRPSRRLHCFGFSMFVHRFSFRFLGVLMLLRYSVFKVLSADARHPHLAASAAIRNWELLPLPSSLLKLSIKKSRQPPALPCRLQHSTIGRKGLDRRVRDGYGYFPFTHRHRNCFIFTFLPSPTAGRTEMQSLLLP